MTLRTYASKEKIEPPTKPPPKPADVGRSCTPPPKVVIVKVVQVRDTPRCPNAPNPCFCTGACMR